MILPKNCVLNLSSRRGLTHAFATLSQTVTGLISTNSLTASATLATASILPGSVLHLTITDDSYITATKSGTALTTTTNLTAAYTISSLKIDVISAWVGNDGYGSSSTQGTAANRPGIAATYFNGKDAIVFPMAAKALTLATNTKTDNIFATGGTYTCVIAPVSDGASQLGRIIEKVDGSGNSAWNLITGSLAGGYVKIQFNRVTDGTLGTWTTTAQVVQINVPQIITISYNDATPTVAPVMRVQGKTVAISVTSAPTGTPISDAGGAFTIGNRAAGDRGFEGYHMIHRMWKRVLNSFENTRQERYLALEWGTTLVPLVSRTYGARPYDISYPSAPASVPLLVCLHGGGGDASTFETQLQLGALFGETAAYIFLTATASNSDSNTWNSGGSQTFNNAPDSDYIYNLTNHVKNWLISQGFTISEVILVGHSNGAMMSYRLAIEYPATYSRVMAFSGDVMVNNPNTYTGKIKQVHGADDPNVPLAGGVGIGGIYYNPVIPTVQKFTLVNSGGGVVAGSSLSNNFTTLPSPAAHTLSSQATALALPPYSTTIAQVIYNFVFS